MATRVNDIEREGDGGEPGVDATYHITGPLLAPDYTGVRTGRFSQADRLIVLHIAVDVRLEEAAEDEVVRAMARHLVDATRLAAKAREQRKKAHPVRQAVAIAQRAAAGLGA